jgi:UDP-N-acetylmuramate--alanine ligase
MGEGGYHLVGVAGVGMNPLAQALRAAGFEVTGSDRYLDQGRELDVIPALRRAGIRFFPQDGSGVTPGARAVVVSAAIEPGNPDLEAAARLGIPIKHRAEVLAELAAGLVLRTPASPPPGEGERECIAIAGTSGKTTVTGMVGVLLEWLGDDPTVVNGGIVMNWEGPDAIGNVRRGRGRRWVIEVDESDRSLLRFEPDWAVITNVSADHFPIEESRALFRQFAARVKRGVVERDDGAEPWRSFRPALDASGSRFAYRGVEFRLPMLGRHNAENALQAVMLCERLGHPLERIRDALPLFRGIRRRLELAGAARGVAVIDDYAHNPAKIRAAWEAVAPCYKRVLVAWRPHGFGPLAALFEDLKAVFLDLGRAGVPVFILPVYYAGGTAAAKRTSEDLVREISTAGGAAELARDYDDLVARLAGRAEPGDAVLIMGARDPDLPAAARRIVEAVKAG